MKSTFERVAEWNKRCGKTPETMLSKEYWEALSCQVERIQEELDEAKQAIADKDLVELLDAGCDLDVTVSGFNFLSDLNYDKAIDRVLSNNDRKYTTNEAYAMESCNSYGEGYIVKSVIGEYETYYSVHRLSDDKIMKLVGHKPVSLTDIVFS